jgi:hypothetical protein
MEFKSMSDADTHTDLLCEVGGWVGELVKVCGLGDLGLSYECWVGVACAEYE